MHYKTYIIGAGSIGALKKKKYDHICGKNILTHAHACYIHKQIQLAAIIDIDQKKANEAAEKWHTKAINIDQMVSPDIIIIATPTETHYKLLIDIIKYSPKLVIVEKPCTKNGDECKKINRLYQKAGIPLIVDYSRRFVYEFQKVSFLNNFIHCSLYYTRGLLHEGSHALDLFNLWFGKFKSGKILNKKSALIDYSSKDKTYSAHLSYERCSHVFIKPSNGNNFSLFEIDMLTEEKRIKFTDNGLVYCEYNKIAEKTYGDYYALNNKASIKIKTTLPKALINLLDVACAYLNGESKELVCTIENALDVHEIYEGLING